jgi:predicted HicB family RNase H-like nuclease
MSKYINVRLNSEVHRMAKIIAAIEEKGMQEYIEECVLLRVKKDYPDVYKKIHQQKENKPNE